MGMNTQAQTLLHGTDTHFDSFKNHYIIKS